MNRARVMHVIDPAPFGGAETVVKALSQGRQATGETSVAPLVDKPDHPFVTELVAAGIDVEPVVTRRRRYWRQVRLLVDKIRARRVSCVHTHVYHADAVGYLAARRAGCAVVATYHGSVGGSLRGWAYEWADRRLFKRFDAVICVSAANRHRLLTEGHSARRLYLVPNATFPVETLAREEARSLLDLPAEASVVGWVGRMTREKGPDLLLSAVQQMTDSHVQVIAIGDGPDRPALERDAANSGLAGRLRFLGALPNAARLIRAFDVLVISSRSEGLPMVLTEAMQAGVPVVGFPVGGLAEYLDETTSWLAPPGDCAALARALDAALRHPDQRRLRAARAQKRAAEWLSLPRWIQAVEEVYVTAISANLARRPGASLEDKHREKPHY